MHQMFSEQVRLQIFFQQVSTLAWAIDLLNSLVTEEVMLLAVNFSILAEIPSEPVDLDTSRDARRSKTSSSEQRRYAGGEKSKPIGGTIGVCDLLKHA